MAVACAAVAVPVAAFAAPANAAVSTKFLVHETSGSFNIGAPTLGANDPVTETPDGRQVHVVGVSGNQIELQLVADTSKCVAATNNDVSVVLHPCNGGAGVVWTEVTNPNGHVQFESRAFPGSFLAGHNDGTQFKMQPAGKAGWFYNFDFIAVPA